MKKYCWKSSGFKGNAQKVGEEIEKLEVNGSVDNKQLLNYAKEHKDSELYKCFEWDDNIAGEKYRLLQASNIISSISFEISQEPLEKQKVYISIKKSENSTRKFKNIKDVLEDDEEYKVLLNKAQNELNTCKNNYEKLIKKEDLKEIIFNIYKEI